MRQYLSRNTHFQNNRFRQFIVNIQKLLNSLRRMGQKLKNVGKRFQG
ncbi:unnamed protein product [Paramecium sonneborni]|uniref:Uncharacterized protein n=1 Tax=Paramecium sonneborni TaxID=65129 RepID=A0A8S1PVW5_9CILI|nr:unnamed protein product [Paramecium sonneborni]